jgi:hypothetical protein
MKDERREIAYKGLRFLDVNGNVDRVENSGLGFSFFFWRGKFFYYYSVQYKIILFVIYLIAGLRSCLGIRPLTQLASHYMNRS